MEDKERIITQKSKNVKLQLTDLMGGIGIIEIAIITIFIALEFLWLYILKMTNAHILIWLALSIIWLILGILFITPQRNGEKVYYNLWKWFKFHIKTKKIKDYKIETGIYSVEENKIYFEKKVGLVFKIKAKDISFLNQNQRDIYIEALSNIYKVLNVSFEINVIEENFNLNEQINFLNKEIKKQTKNQNNINQLENYKETLENISLSSEIKNKNAYLTIYGTNLPNLKDTVSKILNTFDITFEKATEEETIALLRFKMFGNLEIDYDNIPSKMVEKWNSIKLNDKFVSFVSLEKYPTFVQDEWLKNLAELDDVSMSIYSKPIEDMKSLSKIDRAIKRIEAQENRNVSKDIKNDYIKQGYYSLLNQIQNGGESLNLINVIFMITANSEEEIKQKRNLLITEIAKKQFIVNEMRYRQKEALKQFFTQYKANFNFQEISNTTLAASYPFRENGLQESNGSFIGLDQNKTPVLVNLKNQNSWRPNSNILIAGETGFGKTYLLVKFITWLISSGNRVYIVDPEKQYYKLIEKMNGQIIMFGNNEKNRINPLEIFTNDLQKHLGLLEEWFKILFPDTLDSELSKLQKIFLKAYNNKKIINKDYDQLKSDNYPTLSDVFKIIKDEEKDLKIKSNLFDYLWKLAEGHLASLWNGISNVDFKKDLILFDTSGLPKSNKREYNAQLFLMVQLLDKIVRLNAEENIIKGNYDKWTFLAIDEAHNLINKKTPIVLSFINSMCREIRKRNGGLFLASQQIGDFFKEEIKDETAGIFNNCSYHFILSLKDDDLKGYINVNEINPLNDIEKKIIGRMQRGEVMITAGKEKRFKAAVIATKKEEENIIKKVNENEKSY